MQIDWIHHSGDGPDTLNLCFNALDRHVIAGHADRTALVYDSPVTGTRSRAADGVAPQPAPAPGPCTAAVAALGLCKPTKNP